jgi:hypothetical protein
VHVDNGPRYLVSNPLNASKCLHYWTAGFWNWFGCHTCTPVCTCVVRILDKLLGARPFI